MKKFFVLILLSFFVVTVLSKAGFSQDVMVSKRCPVCGKEWDGNYRLVSNIPAVLPKPKNQEWVKKFNELLSQEMTAEAQYRIDQEKFGVYSYPYGMILPQDQDHIRWLIKILNAYGLSATAKTANVKASDTLEQAYDKAIKMEQNITQGYEWIVPKTENDYSKWVLNTLLLHSRLQQAMFTHALKMKDLVKQNEDKK